MLETSEMLNCQKLEIWRVLRTPKKENMLTTRKFWKWQKRDKPQTMLQENAEVQH